MYLERLPRDCPFWWAFLDPDMILESLGSSEIGIAADWAGENDLPCLQSWLNLTLQIREIWKKRRSDRVILRIWSRNWNDSENTNLRRYDGLCRSLTTGNNQLANSPSEISVRSFMYMFRPTQGLNKSLDLQINFDLSSESDSSGFTSRHLSIRHVFPEIYLCSFSIDSDMDADNDEESWLIEEGERASVRRDCLDIITQFSTALANGDVDFH